VYLLDKPPPKVSTYIVYLNYIVDADSIESRGSAGDYPGSRSSKSRV
jgi:hypothetical protein